MPVKVSVTPNGRMSLPSQILEQLGLADGGTLLIDQTEHGIVLRTVAQSIAHSQALAKGFVAGNPGTSVDAFLAHRREASGE